MSDANNTNSGSYLEFVTALADLEAQYATMDDIFDACERQNLSVVEAMAVVREMIERPTRKT